jgi:Zn-dependent peptidase ImmA (M78 family)
MNKNASFKALEGVIGDIPKLKSYSIKMGTLNLPVKVVTRAQALKLKEHGGMNMDQAWINGTFGWWDQEDGCIYIMAHLAPQIQLKVLLHELVHAANDIGWCIEIVAAPRK